MFSSNVLAGILIIFFAGAIAYRSSFLHNKHLFHMSLLQIVYLIVIPGTVFLLLYTYMQQIVEQPPAPTTFISDSILVKATLLSMLLAYGGAAIHSVAKMLAESDLRWDESEVGQLNRYFHMNFSHNLILMGTFFIMSGLVLLELNHVPDFNYASWTGPILTGIGIGALAFIAMYRYTHSKDQYVGRWADLKATFLACWLALALIFQSIRHTNPSFRQYQLLLPMLLGLSTVALLNLLLVARRVKRTGSLRLKPETNQPKN